MKSFEQQVRERAYHLWLREGGVRDQVAHHWFQAVRDTLAATASAPDEGANAPWAGAEEVSAPQYRATAASS
jgi:NADH:ubiquinone oxidoreductase subunit D